MYSRNPAASLASCSLAFLVQDAEKALAQLNGYNLLGRPMRIRYADKRAPEQERKPTKGAKQQQQQSSDQPAEQDTEQDDEDIDQENKPAAKSKSAKAAKPSKRRRNESDEEPEEASDHGGEDEQPARSQKKGPKSQRVPKNQHVDEADEAEDEEGEQDEAENEDAGRKRKGKVDRAAAKDAGGRTLVLSGLAAKHTVASIKALFGAERQHIESVEFPVLNRSQPTAFVVFADYKVWLLVRTTLCFYFSEWVFGGFSQAILDISLHSHPDDS